MTWNDIWADMDALKANMQRLVDEDATDEAAVRQLKAMDETYRKALPAGYWRTISVPEFAAHHGFPADPDLDDQHTARDGSQWTFDGDHSVTISDTDAATALADANLLAVDTEACGRGVCSQNDGHDGECGV